MNGENTNYQKSVTGVLIVDGKVLLGRHTYGPGKNRLIVPGGYINNDETPQDAVAREYLEETGIVVKAKDVIGIRFNMRDWYVAFSLEYVSGTAKSDNDENSEVIWLDVNEVQGRDDVPDLTKRLIESAMNSNPAMTKKEYATREQCGEYSLYTK
ncbi:MAG: NUDIX hydrolase [Clostridia bacterium]|nr:NUDIX hydrolase [Clostridia bacterium]